MSERRILDDSSLHGWAHQAHEFKRQNAKHADRFTNELGNEICLLAWISASNRMTVRYVLEGPNSHTFQTMTVTEAERLIVQLQSALGKVPEESVATVIWHDPALDGETQKPGKIIDASLAFMDSAPIGTKLYAAPQQENGDVLKEALHFILAPAEDLKDGILSRIRAVIGETGMVPVTGRERPMLRPEAASTEARFESASLHQFKFQKTFCSACGREFGPGNHGFSHCEDHA